MKNYEIFNKLSNKTHFFSLINELSKNPSNVIKDIVSNLAQRQSSLYVLPTKAYSEIEKKWTMSDFGKRNFDRWYKEAMNTYGDAIYIVQSYINEEPELRLKQVTIENTNKAKDQTSYYLDVKRNSKNPLERITVHQLLTKKEYDKYYKEIIGTGEKWFMPYYKNMYQLSKIKVKGKPIFYNVEVEFDSLAEAAGFIPDEICKEDVSFQPNYKTRNIILQ
jgi:hypothetical protein